MARAASLAGLAAAIASLPSSHALAPPVEVFSAYTGYPPCFRQPLLVPTSPDGRALIAFAEGRNNTYCSGTADGYPKYIVMKSSDDYGASWGPMTTLLVGNPDFLAAVYDAPTATTWLFVQQNSATILVSAVTDNGAAYTPLKQLTVPLPAGVTSAIPAVGTGVALDGALCGSKDCDGTAGRLAVPFICHRKAMAAAAARASRFGPGDVACPGCYTCLLISDDHGKSWAFGAVSEQDGSREASPVQVNSAAWGAGNAAAIYASERNMGNATGSRWHAASQDGGATFNPAFFAIDAGLPDGCTKNWCVGRGCVRLREEGRARCKRVCRVSPRP